jgi:hypothetical protein
MSILKVQKIRHTASDTDVIDIANDGTCTANITNNLSNRNKVINGSMICSQRGTQQTGANSSGYKNACDRWRFNAGGANVGAYTVSQSTTTPDGFGNSLKVDCTTARTPTNNEFLEIQQRIEGQNLQDFAKGTSAAKKFTLSFYVKTNVSGNYVVWLYDNDNQRMVGGLYTVSDSNWNRYTISYPADTTGAFGNDNERSLDVRFVLLAGTDFTSGTLPTTAWATYAAANSLAGQTANVASSTSNEFYLTGVQLEVDNTGSGVATDFEHRSFAEELALCQRYYQRIPFKDGSTAYHFIASGMASGTTAALFTVPFKTTMRANPSLGHSGSFRVYNGGGVAVTGLSTNASSVDVYSLQVSVSSGLSSTQGVLFGTNNDVDAHLQFISEL